MPITDCLLEGLRDPEQPSQRRLLWPARGGRELPRACCDAHPVYIDPVSSLAGGYYGQLHVLPQAALEPRFRLQLPRSQRSRSTSCCPASARRSTSARICRSGWSWAGAGCWRKSATTARLNGPENEDFYAGLEAVVTGHAELDRPPRAQPRARWRRLNPTRSCARTWKRWPRSTPAWSTSRRAPSARPASGSCGTRCWRACTTAPARWAGWMCCCSPITSATPPPGILDDEEAIFHIACLLLRDTGYIQLGGPDADGQRRDQPGFVPGPGSRAPAEDPGQRRRLRRRRGRSRAAAARGGDHVRGQDRLPQVPGHRPHHRGLCPQRVPAGAGPPARLFRLPLVGPARARIHPERLRQDQLRGGLRSRLERDAGRQTGTPSIDRAVGSASPTTCARPSTPPRAAWISTWSTCTRSSPSWCSTCSCYGPIEKGLDASHGGVEYYNLCVDGAALATVADSFAALEQRVEKEGRLTWAEMDAHLKTNWAGAEGERARLMMRSHPALRQRRLARRRVGQCASPRPSPTWSTTNPPRRVTT